MRKLDVKELKGLRHNLHPMAQARLEAIIGGIPKRGPWTEESLDKKPAGSPGIIICDVCGNTFWATNERKAVIATRGGRRRLTCANCDFGLARTTMGKGITSSLKTEINRLVIP